MKKFVALLVALFLCVTLTACEIVKIENNASNSQSSNEQNQNNQDSSFYKNSSFGASDNTSQGYGGGSSGGNQNNNSQGSNGGNQTQENSSNQNGATSSNQAGGNSSSQTGTTPSGSWSGDLSDPKNPTLYNIDHSNASFNGTKVNSSVALFSSQGYGKNVTGGGNLQVGDADYYQVTTAEEFIKAIGRKNYDDKSDSGFNTRPTVVEVMNDIDLGWNKIGSTAQGFSDVIEANSPSVHPTLKQTGVSTIYIGGRQNLTIFSKNGSCISHACFQMRAQDGVACKNVIIRNIKFVGAWEWDDTGAYDNNDWDTFTIRADKGEVSNIWIDHCTFTKPYDGTIDIKYGATDITISWCSFIPYTKDDSDFMDMMNYLESNRSSFSNYNTARSAGATFDDMVNYASINKKVHLIGHSDSTAGDENFRITYCNNYYYGCTERLPRLRMGKAHVYNCIFDASTADALENSIKSRVSGWPSALSFASNGSLGTNYGKLLLENCYIDGINTPLRNNNKKVGDEYTGAVDALCTYYTVDGISRSWSYDNQTNTQVSKSGRYTFFGHSTKNDGNLMQPFPISPIAFDTDAFKNQLTYDYVLFNPTELYLVMQGNVGAGKMDFSRENWLKSTYSNEQTSNTIKVDGVQGKTANLGASRN